MAKSNHQQRIAQLLGSIERDLIDWIPIAVQDLKVSTTAYSLFLWYQDYDDDWLPHIGIATDLLLNDLAHSTFEDPLERYDVLWCPQQSELSDKPGRLILDECELVENSVDECYELLAEQYGLAGAVESLDAEESLAEEFQALLPFREMMHRVRLNLQAQDWSKSLKPMDDFTVIVSDFMGYWLESDLKMALDDERTKRLVARDMFPAS